MEQPLSAPLQEHFDMAKPWLRAGALLTLALALACAHEAAQGGRPAEVAAESARDAPRPDEAVASFHFPGNMPEQREFVWRYADGSYDYAERWDVGIPEEGWQVNLGWDWKVGCRVEVRVLADETTCCTQACSDGGDAGVGHEPPEAFSCMNGTAGGEYDWFLEGLHANEVGQLDDCFASEGPPPSAEP